MTTCSHCHRTLKPTTLTIDYKVGDVVFTERVAGTMCDPCDEQYVHNLEIEAAEMRVAVHLLEVNDRTAPAFNFVRKALGLTREALATAGGVTTEEARTWLEHPSSSAWSVLIGLVRNRSAVS